MIIDLSQEVAMLSEKLKEVKKEAKAANKRLDYLFEHEDGFTEYNKQLKVVSAIEDEEYDLDYAVYTLKKYVTREGN
jgi:hypothetical protein